MTETTLHTFHTFNHRERNLPILKNTIIESDGRYIELTEEIRMKAKLGIIYGEDEKHSLKEFLEEVVKIELPSAGFSVTPETVLSRIIKKHTTKNFNPRNFLSDGYNNSDLGKSSEAGHALFFGQHNIDAAQKMLNFLS